MATYLMLNAMFMLAVIALLRPIVKRPAKPWVISIISLLILTVIFDNVIVGLGVVGYDPSKLLGIYIGIVPIEDFMYALMAVILVPAVWHIAGSDNEK